MHELTIMSDLEEKVKGERQSLGQEGTNSLNTYNCLLLAKTLKFSFIIVILW